jgi:hypothetical protein
VPSCLAATDEGVAAAGAASKEEEEDGYLAREGGWGVRHMGRVGEEMRRVAQVQAEAFHVPVALFNDFFFDFFKVHALHMNYLHDDWICSCSEFLMEFAVCCLCLGLRLG